MTSSHLNCVTNLYHPIRQAFCLSHLVSKLHTSLAVKKIAETPDSDEVQRLRERYPNPKKVVHSLFKPLVCADEANRLCVSHWSLLNGRSWRTRIVFQWPQQFRVTGESRTLDLSEEYAYLLACDMFQSLGVLTFRKWKEDDTKMGKLRQNSVLRMLKQMSRDYSVPSTFKIINTHSLAMNGESRWHSEIQISWPCSLSITGTGDTQETAQQVACLNACIKFKLLGLLTPRNTMKIVKNMLILDRHCTERRDPEFDLFVDASLTGYGAYLVSRGQSQAQDCAHWISDTWPQEVIRTPCIQWRRDVSFLEFYAIVTAVYTWKRKFEGKCVLIWTDNMDATNIVNYGLILVNKRRVSRYRKIFKVLMKTCKELNISVRAQHVCRLDNIAADTLSRHNIELFRQIAPASNLKPKKSKKLLFFLPFQDKSVSTPH